MKKIVIIGANEFQLPLIQEAGKNGCETHVFAWKDGAVGEKYADYFYDISITEHEKILEICKKIQPDGVATIGSDLANITVAYLNDKLGLCGNTMKCVEKSTNKALMRKAFQDGGVWVPYYKKVSSVSDLAGEQLAYPLIIKPTDRSGSRAITQVSNWDELETAIQKAIDQSFEKAAIVEGYIEGIEYSMESISFKGKHTCLAITRKFTTGSPDYIEIGHLEPAPLEENVRLKAIQSVHAALSALGIEYGASHAEFKIDTAGDVKMIEIGSRMGGDCIGSHLVPLSTGQNFVKMVMDIALGEEPEILQEQKNRQAMIRFILNKGDLELMEQRKEKESDFFEEIRITEEPGSHQVTDSGSRFGYYIMCTEQKSEMLSLLSQDSEMKLEENEDIR